jgi:hypothetical protein
MIIPGRKLLNAEPPPPFFGIEAAEAGKVPVLPSVNPIVALPPDFETTTAERQSS